MSAAGVWQAGVQQTACGQLAPAAFLPTMCSASNLLQINCRLVCNTQHICQLAPANSWGDIHPQLAHVPFMFSMHMLSGCCRSPAGWGAADSKGGSQHLKPQRIHILSLCLHCSVCCRSVAGWGAADSMRGSMDGGRSSMSSHVPSGMTGMGSIMPGQLWLIPQQQRL